MEQEKTGLAVQEETSPAPSAQGAPEDGEPKSEEEKKKDIKKKAIKAGVAVVASASVLVGGLFSSPDALLAPEQDLNPVSIKAVPMHKTLTLSLGTLHEPNTHQNKTSIP